MSQPDSRIHFKDEHYSHKAKRARRMGTKLKARIKEELRALRAQGITGRGKHHDD